MKILVIGGTGTMGKPLVNLLYKDNDLSVVCRKKKEELQGVCYYYGNAKDRAFMSDVLNQHFDAIVDFCLYSSTEFPLYYEPLLKATDQYICLSSVQVCADIDDPKTEDSPRFMETDPPVKGMLGEGNFHWYCYEKARIEDVLRKSSYKNWTIIRPSITMNEDHYMWGDFRDEEWTYRIFRGKSVVIPKNMLSLKTSITYGGDVAQMLLAIIGDKSTLCQTYNVTSNVYTWGELLNIFEKIYERLGFPMKIKYIESHEPIVKNSARKSYYERTRTIDRTFDSTKVYELMRQKHIEKNFASFENKLEEWINRDFCRIPQRISHSQIEQVARLDSITGEETSKDLFEGNLDYLQYLAARNLPGIYYPSIVFLKKLYHLIR